ncbi:NB-ARC domains-containing protein [Tanacetum coccineum]
MATTSIPHRWKYDVFVSFSGDDIRKNFMDHMFNDFKQKGIYAFRDDRELPKGEDISPHLYKAIEESRFLIVIFSKNYASSSWCLQELVKILECKQIECPIYEVQTVFYDVKPDVVRKQTDSYAEAFDKHQRSNRPEVDNWKEALSTAANLSGWDLEDMTNGYEYKFIDCLSKDILNKLCDGPLHVGENLVGIDFHFDKLDLSRFVGSDKVNMIGICEWDEIHDMDFSNDGVESLELFRSYAFKEKDSSIEFKEVSQKVVKYVQGHPLALKVLGRFLYAKTVGQWVSELDKLKVYPNEQIHRVLRLSYDGLDLHQKNILLDIACLFVGENMDFVASVLDGCNFFADTNMQVLVDKSLITISSKMSLQMHDLIQAMAREIVREESIMTGKQTRLWNSSEVYNVLSEKKVPMTEAIEVLVLLLRESSQKVHINANSFALMKNLRILKIYAEEEFDQKVELNGYNVKYSGSLYFLSNKLSLLCWHGCPFKYLPSDFFPHNIVVIDLSYSNIKQLCTTPKSFRRLKVMKLRYCCNLTTTPDFSKITNLEELNLEGCVNLVSVHPSVVMLKRLVVLKLTGCLKVDQLPEALGRIKSLMELHVDKTAIRELPSFVSSLINLESLSFGGQGRIQPRWWTAITAPFGLLSKQQHPQRSLSLAELMVAKLPLSVWSVHASDCASLREVLGSSKRHFYINFKNCPKLFNNDTIDSEGSISKTQCLDSSITSQCFIHQLSAFLGYVGLQTNICEFFRSGGSSYLDIGYHGNSMPEWFTNRSMENHLKVELPSDWCYDKNFWGDDKKFRGYATCVVFKCKKPQKLKGCFVKNFDGASLTTIHYFPNLMSDYLKDVVIGIPESYMIWLHYNMDIQGWKEAKNFVTFSFEEDNEDVEVKECGVRLIRDEDIKQEADLSMLQGLPTPTQHGGVLRLDGVFWSW